MVEVAVEAGIFGGLKAPNPSLKSPEDSKVCKAGIDGEGIEAGDPRLFRLLNPAGEVKLCSDVDPKLLENKTKINEKST